MSIAEFLSRLKKSNIAVHVSGDQLRIRAPEGKLAPHLFDELKERKHEIIEFLSGFQGLPSFAEIPAVPKRPHYLVSHGQRRLWVLDQFQKADGAYNIPAAFWLDGSLDLDAFNRAFAEIVQRHESLRTSFAEVGGQPEQIVHDSVGFAVKVVDLSRRAEPGELAKAWAEEDASTPFDLSLAPLLRVSLLKLAADRHLLVFNMHHIVSDGWSLDILVRELSVLYRAYKSGLETTLAPLRVHYKDYAGWQNRLLAEGAMERERVYWREKLSGDLPVVDFPADFARSPLKSYRGDTLIFFLDPDRTRRLTQLAREQDVTLYMLLTALVKVLLYRHTGQTDIVVGSPIAGRNHPDLENQIGFYVNMVALRDRIDSRESFPALLGRVKNTATEAYQHQNYPFDRLVSELSIRRDPSRSPVFDIVVVLQNQAAPVLELEGIEITPFHNTYKNSKFDLTFSFAELQGQLQLRLEYSLELFEASRMERLWSHFMELVDSLFLKADAGCLEACPIKELNILPEAERRRLEVGFNDTSASYPETKTVSELFEEQVARTPDKIAVVGSQSEMTYRELNCEANRIGRHLRRAWRIGPGDLVALLFPPGSQMIAALLGVLKAGGAYVPIDPTYPRERIAYLLADSRCKVLLTDRRLSSVAAGLSETPTVLLEQAAGKEDDPLPQIAHPDSAAYVIYTSGSTGNPKGCLVSQRNVVRLLRNDRFPFDFSDGDVWIMAHSFCFDFSVWEIFGALLYGGKLVVPDRQSVADTAEFLDLIRRYKVTVLNQTPGAFDNLAAQEELQADHTLGRHLRYVIFGGAKLDPARLKPWVRLYPLDRIRLINMYGITETTVHVTFHELRDEDLLSGASPIGAPLPETTIHILDADGNAAPVGASGELYVGGTGVSKGYLNRPELTAQRFVELPGGAGKWYRTGDLGRWLADGRIEFIGRKDLQVKVRGYRVEPGEIEFHLVSHPGIQSALVLARPDPANNGTHLVGYLVLRNRSEEMNARQVRAYLAERLPDYMLPSYYVFLDQFPLTSNGKVDTAALPAPGVERSKESRAPRNEAEEKLASIWQEVLRLPSIGIDDNFFDGGGDSIKAVQIAARLRQMNLKMKLKDLFTCPTIAELAPRLEPIVRQIDQGPVEGKTELTPIQGWFFETHPTGRAHFNQSVLLWRREGFDSEILLQVFTRLVEHHDVLRMVYEASPEGIVQRNRGLEGRLFDWTAVDLRSCPAPAIDIEKEAARIQAGMNLGAGPLVKLALFRTSDGDHLLISIHHLVIDGVSWRILLEDFALAYRRTAEGRPVRLLPKTHSFQHWAECLKNYSQTHHALKELGYWDGIVRTPTDSLPADRVGSSGRGGAERAPIRAGDCSSVEVSLTQEETRLLNQSHRAYNTTVNDLLLTALILVLQEQMRVGKVLINLEAHGRDEILEGAEVTRTVGWFTAQFPLILEAVETPSSPLSEADLSYQIRSVKETLRRVPSGGIGYGILRYLTPPAMRQDCSLDVAPEISFNYLGQFEEEMGYGVFTRSPFGAGGNIGPDVEALYRLDINGFVADGCLTVSFTYPKQEYEEQSIRRLAEAYRDRLIRVIEHCQETTGRPTPSDLGDSDLSLAELDSISAVLDADGRSS